MLTINVDKTYKLCYNCLIVILALVCGLGAFLCGAAGGFSYLVFLARLGFSHNFYIMCFGLAISLLQKIF